jgi:hypothetical protein
MLSVYSGLKKNNLAKNKKMNIIEKTDEEILAVANPFWNDLVKYSI